MRSESASIAVNGCEPTKLSSGGEGLSDPGALLNRLKVDRSVAPVGSFRGGTGEAKRVCRRFLDQRFL